MDDFKRLDKVLLVLATSELPLTVAEVKERAVKAGFREMGKWNVSSILSRSKGRAINTTGWELSEVGRIYLQGLGAFPVNPSAVKVAADLRTHLNQLGDEETRNFVEEAVRCHENGLFRSAVVMSWLGAMDVLQKQVHRNHLALFNAEASRVNSKWKPAKSQDDLGKMRESDFLDRIETISVIGKNVKTQLKKCLDLRNACGHPNSLRVSVNTSAAHLETLLLNVFDVF